MPGLAAGSNIFEYIDLPPDDYECHYLEWLIPESIDESLTEYTKRLSDKIIHKNPILIGVSFGGILVQELSILVQPIRIIIISSIKHNKELPKRLILLQRTRVYKFFPTKKISEIEDFSMYGINKLFKKKIKIYNKYFQIKNKVYLNWAIHNLLNWKSDLVIKNLIHIHGSDDGVFPIKHIDNCIEIKEGTHAMIITKAKKINTILQEII